MQVVKCNKCGKWIGKLEDLILDQETQCCPVCKVSGALMDVEYSCNFDDGEMESLWQLFGYVDVNDEEEILEEFLGFRKETNRFEIWHWFDERYTKGVEELVNGGE